MEVSNLKILIVGCGVTPIALAKKLLTYKEIETIYITGSNNISNEKCVWVDIRENDVNSLLCFAVENNINLTIPTSDKAFSSDIVSYFQSNGQNIFGSGRDTLKIALSNIDCKKFLYKIHAQTPKFAVFDKIQTAMDWVKNANFPILVKCNNFHNMGDRLVCPTINLANKFIETLFSQGETGILLEEYTYGHNFTIYYISDGYSALPITTVANYKFENDDDGGIYTNGVGCYAPDYKVSSVVVSRVNNIVKNILTSLDKNQTPYLGIMGIECTITGEDKFFVNDIKPFFQDYDVNTVLNLVDDNLVEIFEACISGIFADEYSLIKINDYNSASVVVSSSCFNKKINGLENIDLENIEFINVKRTASGECLTNLGNAFIMTNYASTLNRATNKLYTDLGSLHFEGMKYRKDIGRGSVLVSDNVLTNPFDY